MLKLVSSTPDTSTYAMPTQDAEQTLLSVVAQAGYNLINEVSATLI